MLRQLTLLLLLVVMIPLTFAQPQSQDEIKFRGKQAKELNSYANKAYKDGFPSAARGIWLMLLSEYDRDNTNAREKLGYQRSGKTWVMRPGFAYPREDSTNHSKMLGLKSKWAKTSAKVASAHRNRARKFSEAGRTDLAEWHWKRVLFFDDDDIEADAALNRDVDIGGVSGTELEKIIYDRSLMIADVVAEEARKDYDVEVVEDGGGQPFLDKANLEYITVKSEHFTIYGDFKLSNEETGTVWNYEILKEAARNGERALRVMQRVMGDANGINSNVDSWTTDWAFLSSKEAYVQVMTANKSLIDPKDFEFLKENSSGSGLGDGTSRLKYSAAQNEQGVYDGAVRHVAQSFANLRSDAMREGLGHTIVGMFFNYNRLFAIDLEEQLRSSTGEDDPGFSSPDMEAWKDLALEMAWKLGEGTSAAELPLLKASDFPDDARIKSWSFCDYLMRRDPNLLSRLDQLRDQARPIEVAEKFQKDNAGLSIDELEVGWKDFWTGANSIYKKTQDRTEPLSALTKDVSKWLKAFNDERMRYGAKTKVKWSEKYSGRCANHVRYLIANEDERGAAAEQMENISLPSASHNGDLFAHMALVETNLKKPKVVFKRWMSYPGFRDALLNDTLRIVGLYSEDGILVMDAIRGLGKAPKGQGGMKFYPKEDTDLPGTEVAVADLGPEVKDLLDKLGYGDKEVLGYPLSLHHFGTGGLAGPRDGYTCSLTMRGEVIPGILHMADGGENRRSSAPGMVVFYPLDPLPKGKKYMIKWNWENKKGGVDGKKFPFET